MQSEVEKIMEGTQRIKYPSLTFVENGEESLEEMRFQHTKVEQLFLGHVIFSFIILIIEAPIAVELLKFDMNIGSPYYFSGFAIVLASSLFCLSISKSDESLLNAILICIIHVSVAAILGPIMKRHQVDVYLIWMNYITVTATTALIPSIWLVLDEQLRYQQIGKLLKSQRKQQSCWFVCFLMLSILSLGLMIGAIMYTNYMYDQKLRTSIYSHFTLCIIALNVFTIANIFYSKSLIDQQKEKNVVISGSSITDSVACIHINIALVLAFFAFTVVSSIFFIKAMSIAMDFMSSIGIMDRNDMAGIKN